MINYTDALIQSDMYPFFLIQLIRIFCLKSLKSAIGHYFFCFLTFWSVLVYKVRGFSCRVIWTYFPRMIYIIQVM